MNITVRKGSVRRLIRLKRLPHRFRMYVSGSWLYDVLKANRLHEKVHLWNRLYWVRCLSLNVKKMSIRWR
jgi:hypothetical protein